MEECTCKHNSAAEAHALKEQVDAIIDRIGPSRQTIIPLLQALQEEFRYLPAEALERVYERTEIDRAQLISVATFYSQFRHIPYGKHLIKVCTGTACHVKGAGNVYDSFRRELGMAGDSITTTDQLFSIEKIACLGCCTLAPVVQIDEKIYGHVLPGKVGEVITDFLATDSDHAAGAASSSKSPRPVSGEIRLGMGSCCQASGSTDIHNELVRASGELGIDVQIKSVGCVGVCNQVPLIDVVLPNGTITRYPNVKASEIKEILHLHFQPTGLVKRIANRFINQVDTFHTDSTWDNVIWKPEQERTGVINRFLSGQKHISTEGYGLLAPLNREEYIAHGGFEALTNALTQLAPSEVVEQVLAGGLRGRGGGGFATGKKWEIVAASNPKGEASPLSCAYENPNGNFSTLRTRTKPSKPTFRPFVRVRNLQNQLFDLSYAHDASKINFSTLRTCTTPPKPTIHPFVRARQHSCVCLGEALPTKYVICNGDEGDPGAFMDRMMLESYPFRIIEGMLIAGYAVGATHGIFYIRAEYPLAVVRIRKAIELCREKGLIGANIAGSSFSFDISIFEGAGAFVCGEETALIASIEGDRGFPKQRPPYPAVAGLHGLPTLVNNVETMSQIPYIIRHGSAIYSSVGTEGSKGTKVFALAGKIRFGGLIEVPMGITLNQIINDIGGGVEGDEPLKAVQIGGPSGGCIPANLCDVQVDFDAFNRMGAMMGSGGLVVLSESDCMVDMARYFLEFTCDQSCGKCTFCRVGIRRMLDLLDKLCSGRAEMADIDKLEELALAVKQSSLCGLGRTAPNPVLTTLKYFREEYIEHVNGLCRTGTCKDMINFTVTNDCVGCTKCAKACPVEAIPYTPYAVHTIDIQTCVKCGLCIDECSYDAIRKEPITKNNTKKNSHADNHQ